MASCVEGALDADLSTAIKSSKVLVVGAGGIGCELLKNLVMCGFLNIEIIDLDTIDVSNLNRQFLFHKQHVGKSKAEIAKISALKFNPNVTIKHYHDSIIGHDYSINFFKEFSIVMNALDNRAARNHVNRMCLAADVPLIESGTAGYEGQVELIKKGMTRCYECEPKAAQKQFPNCTIRNTPSEPIHCIVWSKHLFNQLFGEEDADENVSPDAEDPEAAGSAGQTALSENNSIVSENNGNIQRKSTRQWAQETNFQTEKLFNKLFKEDIKYLLSMEKLWSKRQPPTPLEWGNLPDAVEGSSMSNDPGLKDLRPWSIAECAQYLKQSIAVLSQQFRELPPGDHLVWDKDDKHALDFVTACSNIRAYIFGIPQKTRFDIKSMAGNIIPAIATTNAITAGVVVLRALHILQSKWEKCQTVYLRLRPNHKQQLLVPEKLLNPPKDKCFICSEKPEVTILLNVNKMKVKELEENVLKGALHMAAPDVILQTTGMVVISSEEDDTDTDDKTLAELSIQDGSVLTVDDFIQNYVLRVIVKHHEAARDEPPFKVIADPSQLKPKEDDNTDSTSDKDLTVMEEVTTESPHKRKLQAESAESPPTKKHKATETDSANDVQIL